MLFPCLSETMSQKNFAKNLRYLRTSLKYHISQKSLARILKLPEHTIKNYELCRSAPNAYAAYVIAAYFHCSVEDLLAKDLSEERVNHFEK